jgi:hypothetical protein
VTKLSCAVLAVLLLGTSGTVHAQLYPDFPRTAPPHSDSQTATLEEDDRAALPVPQRLGQGWAVLAPRTIGHRQALLHLRAGWPGITATGLYGYRPDVDLGLRISLNYGFEGLVRFDVTTGARAQGVFRMLLYDRGELTLGVEASPGLIFYFPDTGFALSGLTLPVGGTLGLQLGDALEIHFNLSLPMFLTFGSLGAFTFPILVGTGAEYFLTNTTAITVNTRAGPSISTDSGQTGLAFELLVGAAFKL